MCLDVVFAEVRGTIQEDIAKELEGALSLVRPPDRRLVPTRADSCLACLPCRWRLRAEMAVAKVGTKLTFEDIWRFRGRHVAGKPGDISVVRLRRSACLLVLCCG